MEPTTSQNITVIWRCSPAISRSSAACSLCRAPHDGQNRAPSGTADSHAWHNFVFPVALTDTPSCAAAPREWRAAGPAPAYFQRGTGKSRRNPVT